MTFTQQENQAQQAAVLAALDQYHAALQAIFTGDVNLMCVVWSHADDVTYLGPDNSYRVGWQAVLADWQAQADMNLGGNVEFDNVHIVVGPALAIVHKYVQGTNLDRQGNPENVSLRATVTFRREADAWKVISVQADLLSHLIDNPVADQK
ncbi:MAG: nuclear transport factor 2 family protein [Caldilineaceae bacterium]|nr:nuclear transport factor 2 family protein [Caldilineaceae bacterium]MCB0111650.1 nuclear transport factor 2 family protein [Caldilineaceae bacterium]MCB0138493.1 nuclear transport factor 2 family protein [Caldilineaceae bacterium]